MALFSLSATLLPPPASIAPPDNEAIRPLVPAGLVAQGGFAPGGLWLAANRRATFATAMRMVTRVHHRASHSRTTAHMSRTSRFPDADILMIDVAHLPDGRHTENMDITLLTRR